MSLAVLLALLSPGASLSSLRWHYLRAQSVSRNSRVSAMGIHGWGVGARANAPNADQGCGLDGGAQLGDQHHLDASTDSPSGKSIQHLLLISEK